MVTSGIVREWHDDQGWGVIDSSDTRGGCWAHLSWVEMAGYRTLLAGQMVTLSFEDAEQDGYSFRATHVGVAGDSEYAEYAESAGAAEPAGAAGGLGDRSGSAYSSSLTIGYRDSGEP